MMKKMTKKQKQKLQPNRVKIEHRREKQKKAYKRINSKLLNPTPDLRKSAGSSTIKTNKLSTNPLFIKFLNWKGDKFSIENFLENLYASFESDSDKNIVEEKKNNLTDDYLDNLSSFQKVFNSYMLETIQGNQVSDNFLSWLSNSYKYISENTDQYLNDEIKKISIVNAEGRWFESIVCHNFIMTHNYFGADIIKRCPVCSKFFAHKGRYAKYCSEGCKQG